MILSLLSDSCFRFLIVILCLFILSFMNDGPLQIEVDWARN
jgi:hypothetical protein